MPLPQAPVLTATPAAHAEIVAPEPSSRLEIPAAVTDFFQTVSPLPRHETEQALKIGAAWFLISTAVGLVSSIVGGVLGSSTTASSLTA